MLERDVLVALVAFCLGLFIIHAAYIQRPSCFEFWLVKKIDTRFGRQTARTVVGFAGLIVLGLGLYVIVFPSKIHTSQTQSMWIQSMLGQQPSVALDGPRRLQV